MRHGYQEQLLYQLVVLRWVELALGDSIRDVLQYMLLV